MRGTRQVRGGLKTKHVVQCRATLFFWWNTPFSISPFCLRLQLELIGLVFFLVWKRAWGGRVETKWETLSAWNIHSYDRYTVFVYLVTPKTYLLFVTLRELSLRLVYLTLIIALVDNFTRHCTQFNQDILYNDEKQWRLFVKSSQQMWAIENSKYISLTYPLFSMRHAPMSCNELHRYWTVVLLCYVRSWMISWWSGMVQ